MNSRVTVLAPTPRRRAALARRLAPVVFLAPAVLLMLVFLVYPLVDSFRLSLFEWNGLGADRVFVGLGNWAELLHDTQFRHALRNNLLLALLSVLIQLPIALALALLLSLIHI